MIDVTVLKFNVNLFLTQLIHDWDCAHNPPQDTRSRTIEICKDIIDLIDKLIFNSAPKSPSIFAGVNTVTLNLNDQDCKTQLCLLRTKLYNFIHSKSLAPLINDSLKQLSHRFLVELAEAMPINDNSCITLEAIPLNRRIYTSTGYHFDLLEIIHFYKENSFINPYNNQAFSVLDTCHIINTIIEYNRQNRDTSLVQFLGKIGAPTKIDYTNGLGFHMMKDQPRDILEVSVKDLSLEPEKMALLSRKQNLMHCLYNNLIKLSDLNEIPEKNLKQVNSFVKTTLMLQGEQGPAFLRDLKTLSHLEIFQKINSSSHDDHEIPEEHSPHLCSIM